MNRLFSLRRSWDLFICEIS